MIKRPLFPMPMGNTQRKNRPMTAQNKIIQVAQNMGLTGIQNQQGTTVIKYDTLPLDGRGIYRFFEEAQTRPFPLSNVGSDGGKLGVGESLVVQRFTFATVTYTGTWPNIVVTAINPIAKTTAGIIDGELTVVIANSQTLLRLPIVQSLPEFNKDAENAVNVSYELDTLLTIMSQLDFVFELRCSGNTTANTALRLTVEGVGSIFSPKQTF